MLYCRDAYADYVGAVVLLSFSLCFWASERRNSLLALFRLFLDSTTMATAATAASPSQDFVDQRNSEWRSDNVGSKLLAKMGWREGQAVGRRQREQGVSISGQGLRAVKRREGLGLGASSAALKNQDPQHVGDFGQVLAALREEHGSSNSSKQATKKKSKRRSSSTAVLPTNKTTHAAVRQSKFQEKSADDLKCIFAGAALDFPKIAAEHEKKTSGSSKKRKSSNDKDKKKKKKNKKEKKEA